MSFTEAAAATVVVPSTYRRTKDGEATNDAGRLTALDLVESGAAAPYDINIQDKK